MKTKQLFAIIIMAALTFFIACKSKESKIEETIENTVDATKPDEAGVQTTKPDSATINSDQTNSVKETPTELEATVRTAKRSYQSRINFIPYTFDQTMKIEADRYGVYNRAEIMPSFPGGEEALKKFIQENVKYPETALENHVGGTVLLAFMVDESGKIYTPSIESPNIGSGLEQESVRLIRQMPKWNPGQIKGRNVKTRFTLPIRYEIY